MKLDSPLIALLRSAYSKLLVRFSTSILLFCLRVETVSFSKGYFKVANYPLFLTARILTETAPLHVAYRCQFTELNVRASRESKTPCCSFKSHVTRYHLVVLGYVGVSGISAPSMFFIGNPSRLRS